MSAMPIQVIEAWRRLTLSDEDELHHRRRKSSTVDGDSPKRKCHYCPEPATTKDHIVPRVYVRHMRVPQWVFQCNLVPACYDCNQKKKAFRSDCECIVCLAAWAMLGPENEDVPVIKVVYFPEEDCA